MTRPAHPATITAACGLCLAAGLAHAQPAEHTFSGKAALYSEYEYRGISQTSEKPAVQLNLDYGHRSGFYLGTFVSNIQWLKDTAEENRFDTNAKVEWDLYGGYRIAVAKDITLDVGYQRYEYPGSGAFDPKPNTDEAYASVTWGPAALKYAYSFNDAFGVRDSKGSDYVELALNYPLPAMTRLALTALVGHQTYRNNHFLSYTVWKAGATYDFGRGLNAGAYVKGTDAESAPYTVKGRDWGKSRLVAFVAYAF